MQFKIVQTWGSFAMPDATIKKTLSDQELENLGFFPLEPSELEELQKTGKVSICGVNKYTVIEVLPQEPED